MTDKKLALRVIEKDEKAFNLLYEQYHDLVYYVVLQIVKHKEDAKDITQDTFIQLYQKIESYKGGNFKYFILQIAKNLSFNHCTRILNRDKKMKNELKKNVRENDESYSIGKIDDLLSEHFKSDVKQIIIYKIVFNFTFDEIAETLKIDKTFAYRSYKASLQTLKLVMEEV